MAATITEAIRNPQAGRQLQWKLSLPAGKQFVEFTVDEFFVLIQQSTVELLTRSADRCKGRLIGVGSP